MQKLVAWGTQAPLEHSPATGAARALFSTSYTSKWFHNWP